LSTFSIQKITDYSLNNCLEMDSLDDITRDEEMGNELVLKGQLPNTKAAKNLMKCNLFRVITSLNLNRLSQVF
jgi:hypothetical protein